MLQQLLLLVRVVLVLVATLHCREAVPGIR